MREKGEVNFLPEELKPKSPRKKAKDVEMKFSTPKIEGDDLLKDDKKIKGGLGSFFKSKKNKDKDESVNTSTKLSRPVMKKSDVNKAREELLKKIKEKQQAGEKQNNKHQDQKTKKIKKPLLEKFSNWLKTRKNKKEEKKQSKLKKILASKEQQKQEKRECPEASGLEVKQPKATTELPPQKIKEAPAPAVKVEKNKNLLITNLIKGQEFTFFDWRQAITINIVGVILIFISLGSIWGYLFMKESKQAEVYSGKERRLLEKQQELINIEKELEQTNKLRNKIVAVENILDNHIYWTNFFDYLEDNTLPGVYYNEFSGNLDGEYSMSANTAGFENFVAQMENWQQENQYTISANSEGAEISQKKETKNSSDSGKPVLFEFELIVSPEIFLKD